MYIRSPTLNIVIINNAIRRRLYIIRPIYGLTSGLLSVDRGYN